MRRATQQCREYFEVAQQSCRRKDARSSGVNFPDSALGQYEDAVDDCNEAIRLKPDYAEAYINRGAAKVALVLKDEARKDFEIALELARKANDAKIVAQAEQLLRDLDAAEGS